MGRVKADVALAIAGLIWGFGFVAQKTALTHIGPFAFTALRFLISALFILPLLNREKPLRKLKPAGLGRQDCLKLALLCGAFAFAVLFQQYGLQTTSVTNAAFLTELYIVLVPFVGYLFYRHQLSAPIAAASALSIAGIWLLTGGDIHSLKSNFGFGDGLVILSAFGFAVQVSVMGSLAKRMQLPLTISFLQYLFVAAIAVILAMLFEPIDLAAIPSAWLPILYAGIASGGIAYTLQAMAQQHTPSADAAIIMSSEALFGGIGGVWLLHERLTAQGIIGCIAIIAAIFLVECGVLWQWRKTRKRGKRQTA